MNHWLTSGYCERRELPSQSYGKPKKRKKKNSEIFFVKVYLLGNRRYFPTENMQTPPHSPLTFDQAFMDDGECAV